MQDTSSFLLQVSNHIQVSGPKSTIEYEPYRPRSKKSGSLSGENDGNPDRALLGPSNKGGGDQLSTRLVIQALVIEVRATVCPEKGCTGCH
jgi:hypothetical protein